MHNISAYGVGVPRVVLAEDDPAIGEPVVRVLTRSGYDVVHVKNGRDVLAAVEGADVLLLDIGLPGRNGLEVCRDIRARGGGPAILMLTARSSEVDVIVGLDAGADDYVTKPFRAAVLLARIRALLRRVEAGAGPLEEMMLGDVLVRPATHSVTVDGGEIALTPKEFEILAVMLRNRGTLLTRDDLVRGVWATQWQGSAKTLDVHVSSLRRKLGPSGSLIRTVRGVGFVVDGDN